MAPERWLAGRLEPVVIAIVTTTATAAIDTDAAPIPIAIADYPTRVCDRDFRRGAKKLGASDSKLVPNAHPEGLLRISTGQQPGVGPAVLSDIKVARPSMNDDVGYQQTGERQRGYHA